MFEGRGLRKLTVRQIAWIVCGAAAGFVWYYFVRCTTGSCPISSSPCMSTAYGALVGILASGPFQLRPEQKGIETSNPLRGFIRAAS